MEDLICANCGDIGTDYNTELKANNLVARCNKCDRFIKNLPYGEPTFYVGKYKDKKISEIYDVDYLKWAHKAMTSLSKKVKDAIQKRIDHLEHLAK